MTTLSRRTMLKLGLGAGAVPLLDAIRDQAHADRAVRLRVIGDHGDHVHVLG